jgi:hypothetical protein
MILFLVQVDQVFLTGEVALPFIALSLASTANAELTAHQHRVAQYFSLVRALLAKARLLGVSLQWPSDVLLAESALTRQDLRHCDEHLLPEARNEGLDFEGDVRTLSLASVQRQRLALREKQQRLNVSEKEKVEKEAESPLYVSGFVYDVGPETIQSLQKAIGAAQAVVLWGPTGVCEVNAFQTSQQAVLQALSALKPGVAALLGDESKEVPLNNGPLLQVWGSQTVEWCRRLMDADGELAGDLVGQGGVLTFLNADSSLFRGLLGRYPSVPLQERLVYRPAQCGEWIYTLRRPAVVEEEEEDDEDEQDD